MNDMDLVKDLVEIVSSGVILGGLSRAQVIKKLRQKFQINEEQAASMLVAGKVLKKGLKAESTNKIIRLFASLGLEVTARPMASTQASSSGSSKDQAKSNPAEETQSVQSTNQTVESNPQEKPADNTSLDQPATPSSSSKKATDQETPLVQDKALEQESPLTQATPLSQTTPLSQESQPPISDTGEFVINAPTKVSTYRRLAIYARGTIACLISSFISFAAITLWLALGAGLIYASLAFTIFLFGVPFLSFLLL